MRKKLDAAMVKGRLEFERQSIEAGVLKRYPVAEYVEYFDAAPGYAGYSRVPAEAAAVCEAIEGDHGQDVLESFHRFVLLTLVGEHEQRCANRSYPPEILSCFERHFSAIVNQMERNSKGFYLHGNDPFSKDFAVCRHKLVPCGSQLVDVRSGVPRSITVRQRGLGGFRFLWFMLRRMGGFRVLYEMHMDLRLILEFNARGFEKCYVRIAKLLECNPEILGVFGSSWWFDPSLNAISPRLNFLREIPASGGAGFCNVGTSEASIGNALANSKVRQRAYESGAYQPSDWLMMWPRKELIAWATGQDL